VPMINANDLTDEQRTAVAGWAEEGAQLAGIQKRLAREFGLKLTYMETRFLVLDMGIELQAEETEEETDAAEAARPEEVSPSSGILDADEGGAPAGAVTVTTDQLTRPGAVVSGAVVFSDGEKATWFIDRMGRPGLETATPGYRPSEADLIAFEDELRRVLR